MGAGEGDGHPLPSAAELREGEVAGGDRCGLDRWIHGVEKLSFLKTPQWKEVIAVPLISGNEGFGGVRMEIGRMISQLGACLCVCVF